MKIRYDLSLLFNIIFSSPFSLKLYIRSRIHFIGSQTRNLT